MTALDLTAEDWAVIIAALEAMADEMLDGMVESLSGIDDVARLKLARELVHEIEKHHELVHRIAGGLGR